MGTAGHRVWSATGGGWKALGALEAGEEVLTAGGPRPVLSSRRLLGSRPVFNLEVGVVASYLVGDRGLLAHNGYPSPCDDGGQFGEADFVAEPNGQVADLRSTPPGSYDQPDGTRTDILQSEDHGYGFTHSHEPVFNTNPKTGQEFINGRKTRDVTVEEVRNIESGVATPSAPKGRQ